MEPGDDPERRAALSRARAAVPGGAALSDAEVEAAAAGIQELQRCLSAAAMPAVRGGLRALLRASPAPASELAPVAAAIEALPASELGCLRFPVQGAAGSFLYVFLAGCPAGHDTDAHLRRLRDRLDDAAWDQARKQISQLLFFGRQMYAGLCAEHPDWIELLSGRGPGADVRDLCALSVDPMTTTLFLKKEWPLRVGLYVLDGDEPPPPI